MTNATNDCTGCPVSAGTHKPADAVHTEIAEPSAETHLRELAAYRTTVDNQDAELSTLRAQVAELERSETQLIGERDEAVSMADKLAYGIAEEFRVDVGEHSSANCPWEEALEVLNGKYVTDSDKDRRIAELEAKAQGVPWPKDAKDVRDFFNADFISAHFPAEGQAPCDEDRYTITAHDFLSAVNWWADFPHVPRRTPAVPAPQAALAAVAWRWQPSDALKYWVVSDNPVNADAARAAGRPVYPLYAHPAEGVPAPVTVWNDGVGLLWDVHAFGKFLFRVVSPVNWDAHGVYLELVRAGYAESIDVYQLSASNSAALAATPAAGVPAAAPDARDALDDTALLDFIQSESWDLRSIDVPTGAGDSDVHWQVIEHHMAAPHEREVGRSYSDDPREAIRDAVGRLTNIAAQAKGEQA